MADKKICKFKPCSKEFTPKRPWAEFCKNKCRQDFHYQERLRLIELGKQMLQ